MGLGGPTPDLSNVDGIDLWKLIIAGQPSPRTTLPINILPHCRLCEISKALAGNASDMNWPLFPEYSAVIQGEMKLILGAAGPIYDGWWSNGDYNWEKASEKDSHAQVHLYNLTADESERHNLADELPEMVESMKKLIEAYSSEANGFLTPQPNLPHLGCLPQLHNGTWAPFVNN